MAQHTHGDGGITCCTEKQLSTVCLDRQRYWIDSFLSYRTREQTSKCFFPFSEIFSSQVLTRFIHSPSHVVRVLQLDHWHSLLRRFEDEVRARICLQRSFSVLHVNLTKEMRLFGLCRRVEPRSRITAGNDSLVDYTADSVALHRNELGAEKLPGFRFYTGCASRQTDTGRRCPVRVFQNKGPCYFSWLEALYPWLNTTSTVYMTKKV